MKESKKVIFKYVSTQSPPRGPTREKESPPDPHTSPLQLSYSYLAVLWGLEVLGAPSDLRDPQDQEVLAPL